MVALGTIEEANSFHQYHTTISDSSRDKVDRLLIESRAKASLFGTEDDEDDRIDDDLDHSHEDECDVHEESVETTALVEVRSPSSSCPCSPPSKVNNANMQGRDSPENDDEQRLAETFVSLLIESSSTSASSNSTEGKPSPAIVQDSWEQVESTTVDTPNQVPASCSKPGALDPFIVWLCGASSAYLPQCPADKPFERKYTGTLTTLTPQSHLMQAEDVLPYVVDRVDDTCMDACDPEGAETRTRWNGHLPLDPVPNVHYTYKTIRNKHKHRVPATADWNEPFIGRDDWIGSASSSSDSSTDHFALNQYDDTEPLSQRVCISQEFVVVCQRVMIPLSIQAMLSFACPIASLCVARPLSHQLLSFSLTL